MSRRTTIRIQERQGVGLGRLLLHTFLTCVTGGFWLVILFIRYVIR